MILGILAALGTTKLSAITLGILLLWLLYVAWKRRHRVVIPLPIYVITGCIALSALWSLNPGKPVWLCLHILAAYLAYSTLSRNRARWGIYIICSIQIGVILWQYMYTDAARPVGISRNASVIGLAGMWGMPGLLPSLMAGLSMSRTALIGAGLFALTGKRYMFPAAILIGVSIVTTLIINPSRLSIPGLQSSAELRFEAITGESSELAPPVLNIPSEKTSPVWRWYGYGFGQYSFHTGQIQPHNIFVRTWYEMGLFSIPIAYCLVYMWTLRARNGSWRSHDWRMLVVAVATGMLTDELLGSVEGIYMILGYVIMNSNSDVTATH